jgi:hypothetical protein
LEHSGHLIPGATLKQTASTFLIKASPLLEEERDVGITTLFSDINNPYLLRRGRQVRDVTLNFLFTAVGVWLESPA